MAHEHWRAAVTRWGDPIFELALLLTNNRPAAAAATEAVFTRILLAPAPADLEQALYAATLHQATRPRQRLALRLRRGVLSRPLAQLVPADRFLLALWLRRGLDGNGMAAAAAMPLANVVARCAALIAAAVAEPVVVTPDAGHVTLERWVAAQLGISMPPVDHPRPCRECQAAQLAWSAARDTLQANLRENLRQAHLPLASREAIDDALLSGQAAQGAAWWRQPRVGLAALLAIVVLVLALLVTPRANPNAPATAAALQPSALVQATLDGWGTNQTEGAVHQRVWARDSRLHNGSPVITDVWLDKGTSPRHRIEVRRDGRLVEWEIADGRARFDYAAEPGDSACRWNTGVGRLRGQLQRVPLRFSIPVALQREVLDARLRQGAYGVGYAMLQRALAADDLRSLGTRVEGTTTLTLLRFTDTRTQPQRQIVLRIDAKTGRLYGVQELLVVDTQVSTDDLWRFENSVAAPAGVPPNDPDGPEPRTLDQLVDPACPALDPSAVISPRTLLAYSRPWYLPRELPASIDRIALLGRDGRGAQAPAAAAASNTGNLLLVGSDRWFTLVASDQSTPPQITPLLEDAWQIFLTGPTGDGVWTGQLRLNSTDQSAFGPSLAFTARGWSRDDLLALLKSFAPFDAATLLELEPKFLDANPLAADVSFLLRAALTATQPEPNQTIELTSTTRVRVPPSTLELLDPYHLPPVQRYPAVVQRYQQLVFEDAHVGRYQDRQTLPDGTVHELREDDGTRFRWYSNLRGIDYTGDAAFLRAFVVEQPVDLALLSVLLGDPGALTITQLGDEIMVEQALSGPPEAVDLGTPAPRIVPWSGDLPTGTWVRQLWLDSTTRRPLAAAVTLRAPDGTETRVEETMIGERSALGSSTLKPITAALTPEPGITIDVTSGQVTSAAALAPLTRALGWPVTAPVVGLSRTTAPALDRLQLALGSQWHDLSGASGTAVAAYRADDGTQFRLCQGPRALLRFVLQHQNTLDRNAWQASQRVPVRIMGADHDAWLLSDPSNAVLVFEVDETLLMAIGPADFLSGPLVQLLPQLEWQPI